MSRTILNFILDVALVLLLVILVLSALVVRFVFPIATVADGYSLWGWDYNAWANLQFAMLAVLFVAVLVHVMLHWSWVCGVIATRLLRRKRAGKGDDGTETILGVVTLMGVFLLLGVLLTIAKLSLVPPAA